MVKPRLPQEIEKTIPPEICHLIYSFLAHEEKPKHSPSLQREVERLQKQSKQTAMYLKGLDDFILK